MEDPNLKQSQENRDLLIELRTQMAGVVADIKEIKDGTTKKIDDHEARLRYLEKESEDHALVKKVVYGAVAFILLAVLSAIVYLVIKR